MSTHHAELRALAAGEKLRWGIVCVAALLLAIGRQLGLSDVPVWPLVVVVAAGGVVNIAIRSLLQDGSYRRWPNHAFCLLDVVLVGFVIVYLGPGGTIASFFLVILPCIYRGDRTFGLAALLSASVAYLVAVLLHGVLSSGADIGRLGFSSRILVDLAMFLAVGAFVLRIAVDQAGQIDLVRSVVSKAADGSFDARAPEARGDRLQELAHDLNRLLAQVGSTIEGVEREVAAAGKIARESVEASASALVSGRMTKERTEQLAQDLDEFQSVAGAVQTETTKAAHEASRLHSRVERTASDAADLSDLARICGEGVASAVESAEAIGEDLRKAAVRVEELGGMSRQIGAAALSNAKIARHTHVLALNAAIEAARAEEHGKEFAVVAERVRMLAAEAGRSAREVGDLISEVQSGISAAADAIVAGGDRATELSLMAGETRAALSDLRAGHSGAVDSISATAGLLRSHAESVGIVADRVDQFSTVSERWATDIHETVTAIAKELSALTEIDRTCQQLSGLAGRLGSAISLHSPPDD